MINLTFDFDLSIDLMCERTALNYLFHRLNSHLKFKVFTSRIYTCFDCEIPKGYSEWYRVRFDSHDGSITYSFFFSSRTHKVYVFEFDISDDCIVDHGCFFKYKFLE